MSQRQLDCGACVGTQDDLSNYLVGEARDEARARIVTLAVLAAWGEHDDPEHQDLFALGTMALIPHGPGRSLSWHTAAGCVSHLNQDLS